MKICDWFFRRQFSEGLEMGIELGKRIKSEKTREIILQERNKIQSKRLADLVENIARNEETIAKMKKGFKEIAKIVKFSQFNEEVGSIIAEVTKRK